MVAATVGQDSAVCRRARGLSPSSSQYNAGRTETVQFFCTTYVASEPKQNLLAEDWEHVLVPLPQTSAGRTQVEDEQHAQSTSSAIMELRRLSGLTWEQLASLFNVARRSLHFWASGKPVNAPNEERLRRVLAVVRKADRGFAAKNRAMLLEDRDGVVPFDLLARGEYETFIELVGTGPGRREVKLAPLSPKALEARRPQRPRNSSARYRTGCMLRRASFSRRRRSAANGRSSRAACSRLA
jgi:transcriptional regulator with XRE-family HTH domain